LYVESIFSPYLQLRNALKDLQAEIGERMAAEKALTASESSLKASLKEKDAFLREIHHIIISMDRNCGGPDLRIKSPWQ